MKIFLVSGFSNEIFKNVKCVYQFLNQQLLFLKAPKRIPYLNKRWFTSGHFNDGTAQRPDVSLQQKFLKLDFMSVMTFLKKLYIII